MATLEQQQQQQPPPPQNVNNDNSNDDNHPDPPPPRRPAADSLSRLATGSSTQAGRGSVVGWTTCPLCAGHSAKKFALGRGIAAHLQAVHTPWNPGRAERRKRRRLAEQEARRKRRKVLAGDHHETSTTTQPVETRETWTPTEEEVRQWEAQVLTLVQELEASHANEHNPSAGVDRTGRTVSSYRDSLPPLIAAASKGELRVLQQMVTDAAVPDEASNSSPKNHTKDDDGKTQKDNPQPDATLPQHMHHWTVAQWQRVTTLLDTRDRHLSTAEHWAAGEGHLSCLQYLVQLRQCIPAKDNHNTDATTKAKKVRRRDGKTCLHYAARNGRTHCVEYLLTTKCPNWNVNEPSGDGTTPFHLACFGLHEETMELLLQHGANPQQTNEWGCGPAHWIGMAKMVKEDNGDSAAHKNDKNDSARRKGKIQKLCNLLKNQHGVDFTQAQKQGHSALHKAAQSQNYAVMEWMAATYSPEEKQRAGRVDQGGHKPSDILTSVGGDAAFVQWMKESQGW